MVSLLNTVEFSWLCQNRTIWVNTYNLDVWIKKLQLSGNSSDSSSSSDTNEDIIESATALVVNFLACGSKVGSWIVWIGVLIEDVGIGSFLEDLSGNHVVAVFVESVSFSWSSDDFST